MGEKERRSYDGEIAGMRKSMDKMADASVKQALETGRIAALQTVYVDQIKACSDETLENTKAIAALRGKQGIIMYLSGGAVLGVIGTFIRKYF